MWLKQCLNSSRDHKTIIGHAVSLVAFQNCAPFTNCVTKIDGTWMYDAEDLDLVILTYRLWEYSSNYYDTTGSLWFYSKDESTAFNSDNVCPTKANLVGQTVAQPTLNNNSGILRNATIAVPSE